MTRLEIQEVLEVCATRLESRAEEIRADAERNNTHKDDWFWETELLRSEAKIIRAGCHTYPELPK